MPPMRLGVLLRMAEFPRGGQPAPWLAKLALQVLTPIAAKENRGDGMLVNGSLPMSTHGPIRGCDMPGPRPPETVFAAASGPATLEGRLAAGRVLREAISDPPMDPCRDLQASGIRERGRPIESSHDRPKRRARLDSFVPRAN